MDITNLTSYINSNWSKFKESITKISKNDETSLITSSIKLFNFDKISEDIYGNNSTKPTSVDALMLTKSGLNLIEFKSGFSDKIAKDNFDEEKAKCSYSHKVCKDYWDSFNKCRKLEKKDLKNSIMLKAVESIITLKEKVFPQVCKGGDKIKLKLIVVIDTNPSDSIYESLTSLAKSDCSNSSVIGSLKNSLLRFRNKGKVNFYYDAVEVYSAIELKKRIDQGLF